MSKTQPKNPRPKSSRTTSRRRSAEKADTTNGPDDIPCEEADAGASGKPTKLDLLNGPDGASIAELAEATGWQPHSVRRAISGALKRKGLAVTSEVTDGVRRYRIGSPE